LIYPKDGSQIGFKRINFRWSSKDIDVKWILNDNAMDNDLNQFNGIIENVSLIYNANSMEIPQISSYQAPIGARQNQLSSYHGVIDDVYLFERVLTEQELLKLWLE